MSISNWTQAGEFLKQEVQEKEAQAASALEDVRFNQPVFDRLRELAFTTIEWWMSTRMLIAVGKDARLPTPPILRDTYGNVWAYDVSLGRFTIRRRNEEETKVASPLAFI